MAKIKAKEKEGNINHTRIEWVRNPDGSPGYTFNPITGCLNHTNGLCKGGEFPCYAYRLANTRLAERYMANKNTASPNEGTTNLCPEALSDPFYPRFWEERLGELVPREWGGTSYKQKPRGIFVCDMGELFGDCIPHAWQEAIFESITGHPQHRFYLLTKQPQNLIKFSPFPENCFVGVTVTNTLQRQTAISYLNSIIAPVRFLSCEPLLSPLNATGWQSLLGIDWLIIGACTGTREEVIELFARYPALNPMPWGKKFTLQPKIEWLQEIVQAADKARIPVFQKNNLAPLLGNNLRQELPK